DPTVRRAASQALVARGRPGIVALLGSLESGDPLAAISAAAEVKRLAIRSTPLPIRTLIAGAETPLLKRIQSSEARVRFASLVALDQLWRCEADDDTSYTLRRIELLSSVSTDGDD